MERTEQLLGDVGLPPSQVAKWSAGWDLYVQYAERLSVDITTTARAMDHKLKFDMDLRPFGADVTSAQEKVAELRSILKRLPAPRSPEAAYLMYIAGELGK